VEQIVDLEEQLQEISNFEIDTVAESSEPSPALTQLYELARSVREAGSAVEISRAEYNDVKIQLEQAKLSVDTKEQELERFAVLLKHSAISQVEYEAAATGLEQAKLQVKALETGILSAKLNQAQLTAELLEEQLSEAKKVNAIELTEQVQKLKKDLEFGTNIVAAEDGRVLEVKKRRGELIEPGMKLIGVEREGKTIRDLEVVLYVPAEEGKQISLGLEAQISPTIVKKEEYGFMIGRVISVSEFPATSQGMMTTLGSQDLVAKLSKSSAPIEVRVELITDSSTISGYKWSSPNGPPITIDSGTLCDGTITVRSQRPIRLVIPKVKKFIMGY
ncbi:MAG: NHLP bacteriocin system secretion protein, partial [Clostridia bacterium]|nr:NHLP bacteriocin system secretion protein [Clostridia bacterium]